MANHRRPALIAALCLLLGACARGDAEAGAPRPATPAVTRTVDGLQVAVIARGLEHPWAIALLPQGGFLVTERPGRLRRVSADGAISAAIPGVPTVFAHGQGGLLDVVLAPDYTNSGRIYFSFAEPGPGETAGTAVASAILADDRLRDVRVIYRQQPKLPGGNHFGSRLAFDGDGHLFVSQGERNQRATAQRLDMLQGKLVRLNLDGSIPRDNPFVGRADARPEIWSYGHRNMQGLAIDPRSRKLWASEHGPRGGDELNLPLPGRNYGWPLITYGIDYSGFPISESLGTQAPGMEQPHHYWAKSPALSGMAFLVGHPESPWNNSLFLGALAGRSLIRLHLDGDRIAGEERLLQSLDMRIRDVRVGADGGVYVLTDETNGQLLRLSPPR